MSDFNPQTNQQEAFPEIPQSDPQVVAPSPSVTSTVKSVPEEIKGFSWGGFFLAPVWGIFNGVWSSLLWFVPVFGQTVVPLVLGFKGREWAWKSRRWNSVDEFRSAQKKWGILGLLFTIFIVPIGLLYLTSSVVSMMNPQGQFQRANEVAAVSDAQMGLTAIERYSARSMKLPFDSAAQEKVPFSIFVKQLEDAQLIKSVQADRLVQKQMYAVMTGPDVTDVKVCFPSELYKKESCVSRMGTSFLIE